MVTRNSGVQRVAVLGNASPRQCGLATFTSHLTGALETADKTLEVLRLAMNDRPEGYAYGPEIGFELQQEASEDYVMAAAFLNERVPDVLCVQHEFGIFGGTSGRYLLELLDRVHAPVVTTLHTVLDQPSAEQLEVTQAIAGRSAALVVMSLRGARFLTDIYGVHRSKIQVIPHGIPDVPFLETQPYKQDFGLEGKHVMLTFGLLGRNKGIETVIRALPRIVERHPDFLYLVLGATHPHVLAHEGESYRDDLQALARSLGVAEHIRFENRYVSQDELISHLSAADLYCSPYRQREQITSGTLAYALGAGKAVLSTPYWHAEELLADGRGLLFDFGDERDLAAQVDRLLSDEASCHQLRQRAYRHGRTMVWNAVAQRYLKLFETASEPKRPSVQVSRHTAPPLFDLRHIRRLTDDLGILQHATFTVPNLHEGYTTDDNARALELVIKAARHSLAPADELNDLATRYLAFLNYAFVEDSGRFRNFLGFDRRWLEPVGSENAHARTLRALATTLCESGDAGLRGLAERLFRGALAPVADFSSPRAWALTLLGTSTYLSYHQDDRQVRRTADGLADRLKLLFKAQMSPAWAWCEPHLSYSNAKLPHGLLEHALVSGDEEALTLSLEALTWLRGEQTDARGRFSPVGCDRLYERGGQRPTFDQQPVEAYASVDAYVAAWRATGDAVWLTAAQDAQAWFFGANLLGKSLYDAASGGCRDGLHRERLNENQGAESTLSLWLAVLALETANSQTSSSDERTAVPA